MGSHKLLLPLGGETVVERTARMAGARDRPLIVVTGWRREAVETVLAQRPDIRFVFNPDWKGGMVTSALAGIAALPGDCAGFFLHHADMPFANEGVFDLLGRVALRRLDAGDPPLALVAGRHGRAGHPVYFPASWIPAIGAHGSGERLKGILDELGSLIVETGCDGVLEDMDSPEEYESLLVKYGGAEARGQGGNHDPAER